MADAPATTPATSIATPASASAVARTATIERERVIFGVATLAAWGHTIDEIRIGELVAVPFGVLNAGLVAAWPRLTSTWRAAASIAFGLFWGLAVIPYHVVPLFEGVVHGQHVSGLLRIAAGVAMVALGFAILRRRRRAVSPHAMP